MKKLINIFLLIGTGILLSSCYEWIKNDETQNLSIKDFKSFDVNNIYSIKIPPFMDTTSKLNTEASFQSQNPLKEAYLIVIDEPKDLVISTYRDIGIYKDSLSVIQNYRNLQLRFIKQKLEISKKEERKKFSINGLDAESIQLTGKV